MIWKLTMRRPVLTTVVFVAVAVFGFYGYFQLPVRENPDVEFPIISVNVVLFGAEPEVIETEIIEPLEERINTIEGLKTLRSTAREQVGTVIAEFELWRDIDIAAQDVRDRVDRARRDLPDQIEVPIVRKLDPDAQPIMWIALTGNQRWDTVRMTTYADQVLRERLENLRGVGQVIIGGERLYAVRIQLDPEELAAHDVTVQDVVRTVRRNNVKIPSGRVESEEREFLVKTEGQFARAEPMNDLIVAVRNGAPIRIRDVGQALAGVENDRQLARFLGEKAVGLGVVKQRGANTVALARRVRDRLEDLAADFPEGLTHIIATDDSVYIDRSIEDLVFTIFLATGLVVLVVVCFLGSLRGALIASLAIPVSLLAGLAAVYALGFTLNVLTLMALILAIGIVVDDAIVVLESCHRHLRRQDQRFDAIKDGTAEVAFPNIANTLALVAVFVPVAFTAGLIGRFFHEFGLTVAVTVVASTITALTLTPMLSNVLLTTHSRENRVFQAIASFFGNVRKGHGWLLDRALNHRAITVLVALAIGGVNVWIVGALPTEFLPPVDRSEFMIRFETPEGSTLNFTHDYAREIADVLDATDEVKHYFYALGLSRGAGPGKVNEGIAFVRLTDRSDREKHQVQVMQDLRRRLAQIPVGRAYVIELSAGLSTTESLLEFVLQHSQLDTLNAGQEELMSWMRDQRDFIDVTSDLKMNKPQLEVNVLRDKASDLGVDVAAIGNTFRYLLGQPEISEIERRSERYEVISEITLKGRMVPEMLRQLYVRSSTGRLVQMSNLVTIRETIGPSAIHHFNRRRSATISSSQPPDVTLGEALSALERHFRETVSGDFDYAVTGRAQDFVESFHYLKITILFAILFVYLVLAGQFESFLQPIAILLTMPLAAIGALAALWLAGMSLNVFSFIGLIMLMGLATKNAILMIALANRYVADGREIKQAAADAARVRFVPVVMTTLSTVIGLLPIALGYGSGGEARAPLGLAVSAGLGVTTVLTLVIIPVVYTLIAHLQSGLRR